MGRGQKCLGKDALDVAICIYATGTNSEIYIGSVVLNEMSNGYNALCVKFAL
jgi:hypothetical protein